MGDGDAQLFRVTHFFDWCQLVMRASYLKGYRASQKEIGIFGVVYTMAILDLGKQYAEGRGV